MKSFWNGPLARGLGILIAVLVVSRGVHRYFEDRAHLYTGRAEWIWWSDDIRKPEPIAFVAERSFTLEDLPRWAVIKCTGAEEYVLYLNGKKIGSNRYSPGAPLDMYDVARFLRRGKNHLFAELRSANGVGGFLLAADAEGLPRNFIVTDPRWTWSRRLEGRWLRDPHTGENERVRSWGRPPFLPWGYPAPPEPRPAFPEVSERGTVSFIAAFTLDEQSRLVPLVWAEPLLTDSPVVLDFGENVRGYLVMYVDERAFKFTELSFYSDGERLDTARREEDSSVAAVPEGKGFFDDAVAREFRYVRLNRGRGLNWAEVIRLTEAALPAPE